MADPCPQAAAAAAVEAVDPCPQEAGAAAGAAGEVWSRAAGAEAVAGAGAVEGQREWSPQASPPEV